GAVLGPVAVPAVGDVHVGQGELQGPVADRGGPGVGDGQGALHAVAPVVDHGVDHVAGTTRRTRLARLLTRTTRLLTRVVGAAEGLVDGVPGGLAVVLVVVEQRGAFALEGVGHPGALVVDAPDGD